MKLWRVAIVGGGPGGLMTAYQLQKRANAPFEVTLFEASPRVGGKILTNTFSLAPVTYEAGAAELYDYSRVDEDPLRDLVAELGLPTRPMEGGAVFLDGHVVRDAGDLRDLLGERSYRALLDFDQRARDWMSADEYYDSDWKDPRPDPWTTERFHTLIDQMNDAGARRYLQTLLHSDLATEPSLTNAAYGVQNYLMNDPAYMRLYTIDGGIERLPRELFKRIEARVLLQQRVLRVERVDNGRLRVLSRRQGQQFAEEFDFVVVALPNNWLPAIEWGGNQLAAAMRKHHAQHDYPGHYLRVSVLFERPFWRGLVPDSYFMSDAFGGCCLYDESSRNWCDNHGVLGWLLAGEAAEELSRLDDDVLIDTVLDALPAALRQGREQFVEGRVHRWLGAVNGLPGGAPAWSMDERHLPEPTRHANLFVVGDYLFDSTLNGVLDSADYVAQWLAARMESHAAALPPGAPKAEARWLKALRSTARSPRLSLSK